jgi:hypothetical protein
MTDPMSHDEAQVTATRIAGASLEENLRIQYWFTLLLAVAAVVTAPIVTVYSALYHFVQYYIPDDSWGPFGVAMLFAWGFFAVTTFVHWRVRAIAKRSGMKVRF